MPKPKWKLPETNQQLNALAKEWVKRLRLNDWLVKARFAVSEADKKHLGGTAYASTKVSSSCKEALTLVNKLESIDADALGCRDLEVTMVHELLHLHAESFDHFFNNAKTKRPSEHYALEAMIELTALALVEAKRGVPRQRW